MYCSLHAPGRVGSAADKMSMIKHAVQLQVKLSNAEDFIGAGMEDSTLSPVPEA